MKPPLVGGLLGAFLGFLGFLAPKLLEINSAALNAILFPGRIFIAYSNGFGPFGQMMFYTCAYLSNVLLYAAVGYGIGWLMASKRRAT